MREASVVELHVGEIDWAGLIPEEDWSLYRAVIDAAAARGLPFAVGGGLAFSAYTRRCRHTKDLDLYVLPDDAPAFAEVAREAGLRDYYEQMRYDRKWIYRSYRGDVIVDFIWQMANYRARVDDDWLGRGPEVEVRDRVLRLLPPEKLFWAKLYVLQRTRCDWPDLLNLLFAVGPEMDWEHLLRCVEPDARVVGGVLSVFAWLCPDRACRLPSWLWERTGLLPPEPGPGCAEDPRRVQLLERLDWFGPKPDGR